MPPRDEAVARGNPQRVAVDRGGGRRAAPPGRATGRGAAA